ncbi:MAG: 30S ribosomal protein S4 [Candidatus Nanohaloarchaea archaeon]
MVKKLKKQYDTPNEGWDEERINREIQLMDDYGLTNKREIYKAQSQLRDLRQEARELVASENETERKELIEKANRLGLVRDNAGLEDILSLNLTDLLDRRLQTAVNRRGYTDTVREARQLVVHGHLYVDGQRVNVPGYLLTQEEEKEIEVRRPEPSEEQEEKETEEAGEEEQEDETESEKPEETADEEEEE